MDDVVCRSRIQTASKDDMVDVCKLIFRSEPRGEKDHLEGWPSHTLVHFCVSTFLGRFSAAFCNFASPYYSVICII
jgi:hypothetical protein